MSLSNPQIRPDLAYSDLAHARLANAHLAGARMKGAFLPAADLTSANLRNTELAAAILTNARLKGADLRNAQLMNASFSDVDLTEADFGQANMLRTTIDGTNLSEVLGLDAVIHRGPSAIGTSTLERTALGLSNNDSHRGEIETFYRAAGVEEHVIEYFRTWTRPAIQFYSCFISYSHTDKLFSHRLHDQLQARGIRCWLDEHDLKPGDRILDVVNDAIRLHDKILLRCSEASLNSWWVKDEIRKAQERERRDGCDIIIPLLVGRYLLDGWEDGLAADLRSRLAADFTGWEKDNSKFEEQFEWVVKAQRADEGTRGGAPVAGL